MRQVIVRADDARDTRWRWPRAALAIALVVAQSAMAAHFALVKHEYRPELGGWVHPGATPRPRVVIQGTRGAALNAIDGDEDSHPEQCTVMGVRRDAVLPVLASVLLPVDKGLTWAAVDVRWVAPSSPRFRVAPKQSPPA